MPRLTVRAAFELLIGLSGVDDQEICCIDGTALGDNAPRIDVAIAGGVFRFNVCRAACAYELGKRTMPALERLAPVFDVPAALDRRRGAGRRTRTHAGAATGERRKNGTRATKRAKKRG